MMITSHLARSIWSWTAALAVTVPLTVVSTVRAADPSASLSVIQTSSTVQVGQTVPVDLLLTTGSEGVAAVEATVHFSNTLSYQGYRAEASIFPTEVAAPKVDGQTLRFARVTTAAGGVQGSNLSVISLTFTALAAGTATVEVIESRTTVGAYSDSTNILQSISSSTFAVASGSGSGSAAATATPTQATPVSSVASTATSTPAATASAVASTPVEGEEALGEGAESTADELTSDELSGAVALATGAPITGVTTGATTSDSSRASRNLMLVIGSILLIQAVIAAGVIISQLRKR